MWDRVITIGLTAAAPIAGLLVRGSRRHRLQDKIGTYSEIAASLEASEPEAAQELRGLVRELVSSLVEDERRFQRRQFDAGLLTATLLLIAPVIVAMVWAWGRDEWWRWATHRIRVRETTQALTLVDRVLWSAGSGTTITARLSG
jgi:hypothetical protein